MEDVTDATGRQMVDDIFEESRLLRADLEKDVSPADLEQLKPPSDPYVAFFNGTIRVDDNEHTGETLVVVSGSQQRRYLLKRFHQGRSFRAWQSTPVAGERLRLLNVYRVMIGRPVSEAS